MKKIKVLHVFGKMDRGGAETLIMNIFRNIDREKFQFDFLVSSNETGDYDEEIEKLGGFIHVVRVPKKICKIPHYLKDIKEIIKDEEYDVVHSHVYLFSGLITKIAKKANVRNVISHSHTINEMNEDTVLRKLYKKYMRNQIKKNSDYLLSCSKEASIHLYETIDDNRIRNIKNGIDLKRFSNIKTSRKNFLEKLGIPEGAFVIGHIGRFQKQKNHHFLIQVFYEIIKEKPNSYLLLLGRGDLEDEIKNQVNKLKVEENVMFLGVREDVPEIINSLDAFVFPSLYEGLGLVLIEVQSLGVPCFVSNTVPKDAEISSQLFNYLDLDVGSKEWADKIINFDYCGKVNYFESVIKKGYSIEGTVKKLERIYSKGI